MITNTVNNASTPRSPQEVPAPDANSSRPDLAAAGTAPPSTVAPWNVAGMAIYLVGVGGCGMSGLARMLAARGAKCSGSDRTPSELTDALAADGISVAFNQDVGDVPSSCDLVIISAAIAPEHPELVTARHRQVPVMSYAEALGKLMLGRTGIAIAGTHGKSTTTAILAHILIQCGLDPSFVIGANCAQIGGGCRTGASTIPALDIDGTSSQPQQRPGLLLAEACEFNRSFHYHRPTAAAILNVEEDHLDIYGSLDAVIESFHEFAQLVPSADDGGYLLIGHEGASRTQITAGLACAVETIGLSSQADWMYAFDPHVGRLELFHSSGSGGGGGGGGAASTVVDDDIDGDTPVATWSVPMPGEHNAFNTAAAAVLAHRLGCAWNDIMTAIESFAGLDRRMQRLGTRTVIVNNNGDSEGEVTVYDDYGHHPTEIDATLRALRAHERPQRLICVFQPHQHSRTRFLLDQFATSFSSADVVIVPHIYFVRDSETEKQRVSAADLVDRLRQRNVQAMHLYPFEAIVEQLEAITRPGDLVVVMGAGPVWQVARQFLAQG